ncbi:sugar ABC transporter permease [Paeniglutamicibacter sp. ABSL32-1]|uniref:carbohydrate ABC transporter permease n=1 Tax=Paeniglutamicibacter quisquiliarum TaxID=2849498 RepID=UPI001C2D92F6|nr:sugar ABC transporter permease [Paeniglutamicibacter quisquiliarum]MBV1779850.1 sugar ABC transporter permease [Paeniglutamicibacter quisquiliarum]
MSVVTPTRSPIPKAKTIGRQARTAALLLAPFVAVFVGMYLAPLCFAVYRSLFVLKRDGLGLTAPTMVFEPFTNYLKAFSDPVFIESLGRVLLFGVVQVPFMLCLATGLALLIDSRSARAKGFFRLTSFLPYAVPGVIAALMWSFLYSGTSSPINALLAPLGIEIPFLSEDMVLWSVANIVTWGWTGYNMIIIYSALQSIPGEILEAAKIDGASAWNIAWHIKIPMVRPALILTAVFSIIGTAQLYNEPKVLQSVSGGSIDSSFTPIMAAQAATAAQNYPYAAATSVILAVLVGILSITFFKITNRGSDA